MRSLSSIVTRPCLSSVTSVAEWARARWRVQGHLVAADLVHDVAGHALELLAGEHVDAAVVAEHEVAGVAEQGPEGRGEGEASLVVELTFVNPDEHRARPHLSSLRGPGRLPRWGPGTVPTGPHSAPRSPLCQPFAPTSPHIAPLEPPPAPRSECLCRHPSARRGRARAARTRIAPGVSASAGEGGGDGSREGPGRRRRAAWPPAAGAPAGTSPASSGDEPLRATSVRARRTGSANRPVCGAG